MPTLIALAYLDALLTTARHRVRDRDQVHHETGASTLELVIIILGLIAVAGVLVVALTAAVQRRVDQIN
ncbi:hypothetical protein [Cellulomonas soli]|uniref:Uncharacterized protein n=1 Tax=Cellulomonas soli TaxID=931535 RepID=A0A512P9I5_9CELL|nr:hypothetical protein [Cellulomonas soli]NYI60338.1 hypothetical protein [Cellulomonas soli]GEP67850.1 hypothetical protein CSO01_05650 [Cellulomonas soli]